MVPEPNKLCSRCGGDFRCGAESGECWCFNIEVEKSREVFERLSRRYEDCLCEKCLTEESRCEEGS
ncbi:MAG: cysteine-rich CWC family protein, partial [Acidobacteriota bacterium]